MVLVSVTLAATPGAQGQESRQQVVQALRDGHAAAAVELADEALKAEPRNCSLLALRGVAYSTLHQPQPALASFEHALSVCPAYLPALEGAAEIAYAERSPSAQTLLERVLAVQPENSTAHAMLASLLWRDKKCVEALPHFRASDVLFASRPDLRQSYGDCLAKAGDLSGALTQFRSLLETAPNSATRYNVALLEWKTHADAEALVTVEPLLGKDAQAESLALAAQIHEAHGDTPEAVRLLRQAILQAPDDVGQYLDFASIAFAHRSFEAGVDVLDAGLKRLPTAAPLYVARGVLEVQLSAMDRAVADFAQAHRLDPKLSLATDAIGMVKTQQHQDAESLAFFREQAQVHPQDPLLQYLLAEQLAHAAASPESNTLQAAIAAALEATRLDPKYGAAHDLLAVLYLRAGQPQLAIREAELALAEDPDDAAALFQELLARRRSGDTANLRELTQRLERARKRNGEREQAADRYHLQTAPGP